MCKKRLHLGIALCPEDGTGAIQQAPAGTQQRPQGLEQGRLQRRQLGDVGLTAQPAHIRVTPHDAGRRARCVQQDGVEQHATALRLPPVLRACRIGHQDLGLQPEALQGVTNTRAARGIDLQRRDLQGRLRPRHLQQVRCLAAGGGAGVKHAQGLAQVQPLQQQRRRLLGGGVLHRYPALGKVRQRLHGHRLVQGDAVLTHSISSQINSAQGM